uniref:CM0545.400.nc protein n=1 Tax=Lotus japonicus TaxID=34305 RepID=B0BLA6_LOTJA|nr:CM0545.400.nc [Lotus japonicus]
MRCVPLPCFSFHFLLLLLHFPSYTFALCNHHDNSALLLFKNSFVVNPPIEDSFSCSTYSPKTESWTNNTDCCEWDGVTCDTMSGHVVGLDLTCSHLRGEIHPNSTIFQLRHLQKLNLAYNDFSGSPLYSEMGDLINLTHLNLSNSAITGDVPSRISHLSKLVSLDLSYLTMRFDPTTWKKLILNSTNLRELHVEVVDMSSIRESSLLLLMNLSSSLVSLHLHGTKLQGNFPSDILFLPNLQELDLSWNDKLRGQLPKSNWSNPLRYLDLSINNLRGQIPSSLFHLTQLSYLSLSGNKLVGPIPSKTAGLSKLNSLSLASNMLNGTIPHWCYSLPSLLLLDLGDNQLTGSISEFSTYSLEVLHLYNNQIQGKFPESIFEFENLTELDLSSTHLSGPLDFHKFSNLKRLSFLSFSHSSFLSINFDSSVDYVLPNLQYLHLSSCNVDGSFPKFLAQLENLQELDLSHNKIHGKVPNWFHEKLSQSWNNIELINLSFNKLQGDLLIPPYGTRYFFVSNNNFSGGISSTMCNASSLIMLNLAYNILIGMIPQCLGTFPSLTVLDLQMNNLYGSVPGNFSKGNVFETIKLNGNRLEGPLPPSLAQCSKLQVLDLGDNDIEDTFPVWLETLQELQVLSLRSNKHHGVITCFSSKNPFFKLRIFDVSSNHFSGPLPASCIKNFQGMMSVSNNPNRSLYMDDRRYYNDSVVVIMKGQEMELKRILTAFTTIDLSNNMFEGGIPKVIGQLKSLIGLNLSHNGINGAIPHRLSNLTNLEWLDLSWNQLTGDIPLALTNLNYLSTLNLSQNHLEGIIPTGGQFNTYENASYGGNPMLCGFPLSKSCNKDEEQPPHSTFQDDEESGFGWKSVAVGYACGAVFGMLLGYNLFLTAKPQWLVTLVEGMLGIRVKRTNNRARTNRR